PILLPRHEVALSVERHVRVLLHARAVRDLDAAGIEERPAGRQTVAVDLSGLLPDELAPHDQEVRPVEVDARPVDPDPARPDVDAVRVEDLPVRGDARRPDVIGPAVPRLVDGDVL